MGRPPLVDRDIALDAIMRRFWRTGYAATSLDDLLAASGLARASFYRAFGDKQGAFTAAVERYADVIRDEDLLPHVEGPGSARERMTGLLHARLETVLGASATARDAGERPGCLVVNSALELAPHEPATQARVSALLETVRALLAVLVGTCVEEGDADAGIDPEGAADQLFAAFAGATVLAGAGADRARLHAIVDQAVHTALKEPPR